MKTVDPTRSHARIVFDGAAAEPLGAAGAGLAARAAPARSRGGAGRVRAGGRRAGRARHGARVRDGALRLRTADRVVPGHQAQARRHVRGARARALERVLRRVGALDRRRRAARRRRRRARERDRGVLARGQGEHPDPRRHGLHVGVRLPPLLPPREAARAQPRQRAPVEARTDLASSRSEGGPPDGLHRHERRSGVPVRGARLARQERRAEAGRVRDVGRAPRQREGRARAREGLPAAQGRGRLRRHHVAEGVRRARRHRDRAGDLEPGGRRVHRAARLLRDRPRHDHADAVRLRHRGAEAPLSAEGAPRRRDLVPALLRARGRLRPRGPAHARGEGRERLGHQRPEDLDVGRPSRGLRRDRHAQRSERAQAQGPDLLLPRHEVAGHRSADESSRSPAPRTSTRCTSRTCASPTASASAGSAAAGAWRSPRS